jgi:tyrosinase
LSWDYQAAIHGTTLSGSSTAWNTCEHGSMFFWSWHRMYLYYFERIVRKLSKNPCWALPYWDWAPGSDLFLPAPFRDPASALFNPRASGLNDGTASLNPLAVDVGPGFSQTSFYTASSIIEGPHGSVHGQVSGNMCCVPTAALDPIFYLHHSNVDRLWNLWLAQGGGRTDPVLDAPWTSKTHTFFDANGAQVTMNTCQVLRAAQQLHYVYEGEPPQVLQYCRRFPPFPWWKFVKELIIRLPIPPVELGPEPVAFQIDVRLVREKVAPLLESKTSSVLLELDDVEAPTAPGVVWAVFVGLPAGAAIDAKSPHFVGQLALFGSGIRDEKHHAYKPAHFTYPITRALQAALRANGERIDVTFVPLGLIVDGKPQKPEVKAPVRIGQASLFVEKATEEAGQEPARRE